MKNMISSPDKLFVFLAFSFKDREHAEEIEKILNERRMRMWMAIREIKPGN